MKYSVAFATFVASALAAKACPAPPKPEPSTGVGAGVIAPKYFGIIVGAHGTHIHEKALVARGGDFYLEGEETIFSFANGKLDLGSKSIGGQGVFIQKDGALKFNVPHTLGFLDAIVDGWEKTEATPGASFGEISNKAGPFLACPDGTDFKIFVKLESHGAYAPECIEFTGLVFNNDRTPVASYE